YRRRLGNRMRIVIVEGTLGAALNLGATPQHAVIGRDGRAEYGGRLVNGHMEAALIAARGGPGGAAGNKLVGGGSPAGWKGRSVRAGGLAKSGGGVGTAASAGTAATAGAAAPVGNADGRSVAPASGLGVGSSAPEFSVTALDGTRVGNKGPVV